MGLMRHHLTAENHYRKTRLLIHLNVCLEMHLKTQLGIHLERQFNLAQFNLTQLKHKNLLPQGRQSRPYRQILMLGLIYLKKAKILRRFCDK